MKKLNAINWFEITATDFDRAVRFYGEILGAPLEVQHNKMGAMAMFPFEMEKGVGGAITTVEGFKAGAGGTIVYLNVEGDLDGVVSRVAEAGGAVTLAKMPIGPWGFIAHIRDTEGNIVGLHSLS